MLQKVGDPGGRCGRGAAHAQTRADLLQRARRVVIELEVGLLARDTIPEIDIRLIPNFEIPLRDFLDAVAIDQVLGKVRSSAHPTAP